VQELSSSYLETLDRYLAEAWPGGPPERIERAGADGTVTYRAVGYARAEACATVIEGWMDVRWTERRLLIRAVAQATAAETTPCGATRYGDTPRRGSPHS